MQIFKKPFLLSIFLGLFLALNFYMLLFYYLSPEFEWKSLGYQLENYAENALLFFTIGLFVSVVCAISIGWPLYLLGRNYSAINYITSGFGGVAVTIVPYIFCIFFGWNIPSVAESSGMIAFFVLVICGGSSGIIFHFLEKK